MIAKQVAGWAVKQLLSLFNRPLFSICDVSFNTGHVSFFSSSVAIFIDNVSLLPLKKAQFVNYGCNYLN